MALRRMMRSARTAEEAAASEGPAKRLGRAVVSSGDRAVTPPVSAGRAPRPLPECVTERGLRSVAGCLRHLRERRTTAKQTNCLLHSNPCEVTERRFAHEPRKARGEG